MDYKENSGRYYLTSADFMQMSPVVRLHYHGTKQFFPQETWRETDYPAMKIDTAIWEDSYRDYPDNEKCENWAHMMNTFCVDRFCAPPSAGHLRREYTIADLNQWSTDLWWKLPPSGV
jgi:hypothetical protein